MPAKVALPLADNLREVIDAGLCVVGCKGGLVVLLLLVVVAVLRRGGGAAALGGLGGLEELPLVGRHGAGLDGAREVRVGFLELAREPVGVGGEDGACLHELGVDLRG